jgi:hypothetical protein
VERTNAEGRPATGPITVLIKPLGGLLHAEGTRSAVPLRIEAKDQTDEFCFDRINFEPLLELGASALRRTMR